MDEPDAGAKPDQRELEPRPPLEADLVGLCRELNKRGARYIVIGGFAVITAGLPRVTGDIDLLVAVDPENEARVFSALSTLPDNAVRELQPGELQQYNVIRVAACRCFTLSDGSCLPDDPVSAWIKHLIGCYDFCAGHSLVD